MHQGMEKRRAARIGAAVAAAVVMTGVAPAFGLDKMVAAVHGTNADLAAIGLGTLNGTGVAVGVIEAGQNVPNTANPFLVAGNFLLLPQGVRPADTIGNHASEVAGVIVSQAGGFLGIAPSATVEAAGVGFDQELNLASQDAARAGAGVGVRTPIINMSLGRTLGAGNNNGTALSSMWLDWAARTGPGVPVQDILFVVAGNETGNATGAPSDSYNAINVGATGIRSGNTVIFTQGAAYNLSNVTADVSAITGLGRQKTDIVAPGGDPGPSNVPAGTFNAPPADDNRFITTGGGVYELIGTTGGGRPIYTNDDLNGLGLTGDSIISVDNTAPLVAGPFPATNPGANLGGNDTVLTNPIAGTSFAAPMVAGAAALLHQLGTANTLDTDHRVLKAILLNGATKFTPDGGSPLRDQNGAVWARALNAGTFTKPNPAALGGGNVDIQVGLDPLLGTGQLHVTNSIRNYLGGEQGPGLVEPVGFDLDSIDQESINSYTFKTAGGHFMATLTWDRIINLGDLNLNDLWDTEDVNTNNVLDGGEDTITVNGVIDHETLTLSPFGFRDLDLEFYLLHPVNGPTLVSLSTSDIDNVEHIYLPFLAAGQYRLDVINRSNVGDDYALAWMTIPEPATFALLAFGSILILRRRAA